MINQGIRASVLLFLLSSLLSSCSFEDQRDQQIELEQRKDEIKREMAREKLKRVRGEWIKQYNVNALWDTLDYPYSIHYENLISQGYQIIEDAEILDIYSEGEELYVSIKTWGYSACFFELKLEKRHRERILAKVSEDPYETLDDCIMVVKLEELRQVGVQYETDYDGEATWTYLEDSDEFYGKGSILEIEFID